MHYYTDVLKKYVVFTGRATRSEYWMFFLINLVISLILSVIDSGIWGSGKMQILSDIYALAVLLPGLAVAIRRLHDTDRTGWWLLIFLIPIVGFIVLIVFFALPSTPGTNKYGPAVGMGGTSSGTPPQAAMPA